jgi:DNA-binding response OmpR family regulator
VLIVDDEPHIVESLAFVLGREGYAVSTVIDGESALDALRHDPPDLVILDVMIPRLNGFEVLKAAKSQPALAAIPVIVLTAKGQSHDRRLAEEIGSDGFMTKPFSNREIVDRVRRLIGGERD